MDRSEIITQLQEFNREMTGLAELSFIKKMPGSGISIKFSRGEKIKAETRFPDSDSVKAICNDVRKFIQKNDPLFFRNLKKIYNSCHVDQSEKLMFDTSVSNYYTFMHMPTEVIINNKKITNGEIFKTFLYGKYSHRSPSLKKTHDKWEKDQILYSYLKNIFLTILFQHIHFVSDIGYVNNCVLEKLGCEKIIGVVTNE